MFVIRGPIYFPFREFWKNWYSEGVAMSSCSLWTKASNDYQGLKDNLFSNVLLEHAVL